MTQHPDTADAFLLFGATGDLARKKIFPALYKLFQTERMRCPIIGISRTDWTDEQLRERARQSIREQSDSPADESGLNDFCSQLRYVAGDYTTRQTFTRLAKIVGDARMPLSFLAIPPDMFDDVVEGMASAGLTQRGRFVVEKPFGRDFESAQTLNSVLHRHLDESQIFRIDHFLGKDSVQNLMVFRFANSMLEPIWNRHHISSISITMAESFGIEGRGRLYDSIGTIRDVIQNHLLQMIALLAMEPPISSDASAMRDETTKVFKAIRPLNPDTVVRGQVEGYRDEPGVNPESDVETYAAMRFEIDSWRWAGVPVYVRAGKSLKQTVTEAVIEFNQPPRMLFAEDGCTPKPNRLVFQMKPNESITLNLQAKASGMKMVSRDVDLAVDSHQSFGDGPSAYERLIADAIIGDERLFARQDGVEEAWRIIQPILKPTRYVIPYPAGSWGPIAAEKYFPTEPPNRCS